MANPLELLATVKESECACKQCKRMCVRPCFPTPDDAERLIEAGYGNRLMLDWHCGIKEGDRRTFLLVPALSEHEAKQAPYIPYSEKGCTFWNYGKCDLHNKKLKPLGGRLAHHDNLPQFADIPGGIGGAIAELWKSDRGQQVVRGWCEAFGVPMEESEPTAGDCLSMIAAKLKCDLGLGL